MNAKFVNRFFMFVLYGMSLFISAFCYHNSTTGANDKGSKTAANRMRLTIGDRNFTATLSDNVTASSFKSLLPMTVEMLELNGNEKYVDLPNTLPSDASNPGTIKNGDLMLYGASTLVLFYKTFLTSYSYTKLGRVDDAAGLAAALGRGNVKITFELE